MSELLIRSFGLRAAQAVTFAALQRDGLKAGSTGGTFDANTPFKAGVRGQGALRPLDTPEVDPATLSYLGTPIMHPITLAYAGTSVFLSEILVTVSRGKTIVMTPVQGRRGTVKEYITTEDFAINVQGLLVGQEGEFPEEALRQLRFVCDAQEPVTITSDYIRMFGVFKVVVKNERFPRLPGYENLQPFEFDLIEDTAIDLIEEI